MATKTNGAELKAFYNDDAHWLKSPESKADDIWHEDLVLVVNGVEQVDDFSITEDLKDEDQVTIVDGVVLSKLDDFKDRSFESFFKAWRKHQNTAYLSVTVPKEKVEALRAAILAAGGSIK
ncbi:hypothetical protein ALQ64_02841 [Pseudomonas cannabina]|uniref:Uncharacterized protein n=1 Tax=Pseudomonas cannabina TaxID=86840 RepID=A0A3M3KFI1_PSECA|nr:hypothetical protein [Pseudomonas cannabina]RMN21125.1 hypothetical protein ALQ64_02841 [Pseudomonas cannabina]